LDEILLLATFTPIFQFQTFTIMSCSVPTDSIYLRFGANAYTHKNQLVYCSYICFTNRWKINAHKVSYKQWKRLEQAKTDRITMK